MARQRLLCAEPGGEEPTAASRGLGKRVFGGLTLGTGTQAGEEVRRHAVAACDQLIRGEPRRADDHGEIIHAVGCLRNVGDVFERPLERHVVELEIEAHFADTANGFGIVRPQVDVEVHTPAGGIQLGGVAFRGADAQEIDGLTQRGLVERDAWDDNAFEFGLDEDVIEHAALHVGIGKAELFIGGWHGCFPRGIHLGNHLSARVIVRGFLIFAFGVGHALHATAGGAVGRIDAQGFLVVFVGLVELTKVIRAFGGVECAAHGIHVLGMLRSECGIGADGIIELGPEIERQRVIGGHVLGKHLVHGGLGGGHIALARQHAGMLHGCLGVALGGGGAQLVGERRGGNHFTGTGIGFERIGIFPGLVGFIAFLQQHLGFFH